ncbi:hypothetical protein Ae706Ps2_6704 [Pseudonocardia sp. Ae706_Ps2]|nr:hypothetical protein Ae706Ps2_6704 [Pseudonocardia sp. Ae706_Ps2]
MRFSNAACVCRCGSSSRFVECAHNDHVVPEPCSNTPIPATDRGPE